MVTAETAVVLPVLLLVLAAAVAALVVVGAQLRCVDAAREAVRAATRGDTSAEVTRVASAAGPAGAVVGHVVSGGEVTVTVSADVRPLGPLPLHLRVSASATGLLEPGVTAPP
jgi:Flp pilus assembly protein TadG